MSEEDLLTDPPDEIAIAIKTLGQPIGVATPTNLRLTQEQNRRTIVGWLTILLATIIIGCLGLVGSHRVSVGEGLQLIGGLAPLITGLLGVAVGSYFDLKGSPSRD